VLRPAGDIPAFVENLSGARGEDARKHVEDGALAGSVRADYAEYLALVDGQGDVVGGDQSPEPLRDTPIWRITDGSCSLIESASVCRS